MKFKLGQKIIDKLRNKKQNENKKLLENVLNCLQSILQINNKILERSNSINFLFVVPIRVNISLIIPSSSFCEKTL